MRKTVWALILTLVLMVSGLAACGRDVVHSERIRVGLALVGEEEPLAAAVTVDEAGVIRDCVIDQLTEYEDRLVSKNQLGETYGMKQASPIGKEWNEQAAAFSTYVTGMRLEEVQSIELDDEGKATDPVLISSATIDLRKFVQGVEEAVRQVPR